jgi:DNA repair protein RecN (Recombination protein N)
VGELEALGLASGEAESLVEERGRLANRGRLAESAQAALALAYEGDGADAHALVARAAGLLRNAAAIDPRLERALGLAEEALIALRESGRELPAYLGGLDADPARQEAVERRVAAIEDLARKHRVEAPALPEKLEELRRQLASLEQSDLALGGLDERIAEPVATLPRGSRGAFLGPAHRPRASLRRQVTALVRQLGMPGGRFEATVEADAAADPAPAGADRVEFLVSANPGEPPKPVVKVASGGELSRISLAVQVAAARRHARTCMIFDEVDAGIGGGVAEIVGRSSASSASGDRCSASPTLRRSQARRTTSTEL